MTAVTSTAAPARPSPRRRRTVRTFLPPQHGAWAMLVVPFVVGMAGSHPRWLHLPLFGAWIAGYLLSYFALQAVKSSRPGRYREPLLLYTALLAPCALAVLVRRPDLIRYAAIFAPLLAVNAGYALARRERALANGAASVLLATTMLLVANDVGHGPGIASLVVPLTGVGLYFLGTTLYVKTMIRERGDRRYYAASVGYHLLATALAAAVAPVLGLLFGVFLARAALLPRRRLRVPTVGLIELANCVLLTAVLLAGWGWG